MSSYSMPPVKSEGAPPSRPPTADAADSSRAETPEIPETEEDKSVQIEAEENARMKKNASLKKEALKAIREAQNEDLRKDTTQNAENRLAFLQQQAEIFAHFTQPGYLEEAKKKLKKQKASTKKGRTRMSEAEEDALMLKAGAKSEGLTKIFKQPDCIKFGTMREYQIEGLNWMINLYEQGINGIMADEMGLGKTLQSISLLGYLKFERKISGPHIVVVPKSVLGNWQREFARWCPGLKIVKVHGTKAERAEQIANDLIAGTFDVCVTTYEVVIIEQSAFSKFDWRYIVIDEAHRLKNENNRMSVVVRELKTQFRLLITGTPLQNNLHELWALLNFLLPEVFSDAEMFEEYFKLDELAREGVVSKLHSILRPFMIRRLKADVEKSLPPKREIKLFTGLSEMQTFWYRSLLEKDATVLNQLGGPQKTRLLNILMQLRKVCNHPYLFQGAEQGPPYFDGPHLFQNSGKMLMLDKLLTKLKANGDRVLIFSQMTRMLDILEDYMRMKRYEYCRIDGSTDGDSRDLFMDQYNAEDSKKFVFLLSTRAGGLGINLATANVVILYDSDWNPQMDLQAQDRAHRIGQKKEVIVFRFVTEGTVEEKIVERAERKLYLDAVVVQQGRLQQQNKSLSKNELMSMVKFGAEAIFKSGHTLTDEDIDLILQKGELKTKKDREKFKTDVQHNLMNFKLETEDATKLYTFEGEDYSGQTANSGGMFIPLGVRKGRAQTTSSRSDSSKAKGEEKAKGMTLHDYQFFDVPAIRSLEAKERLMKQKEAEIKLAMSQAKRKHDEAELARLTEEATKAKLSDEDQKELKNLLKQGFQEWHKKDFNSFKACLERFGRNQKQKVVDEVANEIEQSRSEVSRYYKAFFEKGPTMLSDWGAIEARLDRAERKMAETAKFEALLKEKKSTSEENETMLLRDYAKYVQARSGASTTFTKDNDEFLLRETKRLGYGRWDALRASVKRCPDFYFDYYLKTRTAGELQKRVEALLSMISEGREGGEESSSSSNKRRKTDAAAAVVAGGE